MLLCFPQSGLSSVVGADGCLQVFPGRRTRRALLSYERLLWVCCSRFASSMPNGELLGMGRHERGRAVDELVRRVNRSGLVLGVSAADPDHIVNVKETCMHLCVVIQWSRGLETMVSLSVVTSFEQTDGTQHLPLYMTKLKSPAARRCFPSAPFPSQPAEAGQEKETAANTSCD